MFCSQCGKALDKDAKFCNNCGAKIQMPKMKNDCLTESDGYSIDSQERGSFIKYHDLDHYYYPQYRQVEIDDFGFLFDEKYEKFCQGDYEGLTRKEIKKYKKHREAEIALKRNMELLNKSGSKR